MVRWTRALLGISCVAALGLAFYAYATAPERVPLHYGPTGMPDRWGSPLELLIVQAAVIAIGSAFFRALPEILRFAPSAVINLPHKRYWLSPSHRAAAGAKLALWADLEGAAINGLVIALQIILVPGDIYATGAAPVVWLVPAAFFAYTLCSCALLTRSYRLPASAR
jgi:hypothetical protein